PPGPPPGGGPHDRVCSSRPAFAPGVGAGPPPPPPHAEAIRQWCVDYWEELHPYSMGGSYVNFMGTGEGQERVRATYRDHYDRLAQVKRTYDPDNVLHANQNIRPARRQ
ncbi:BBE domain-containing protein, partial [Streptomyces sp. NPDC005047]